MNKIGIIVPYFGKLRDSFILYIESCKRNPEIDWHFFCDHPSPVEIPSNVYWHITSLQDIKQSAEKQLGAPIILDRAYKLCDLKPFYGKIFEKELKGYDYWGYGDTDVIYGKVQNFLNEFNYIEYDKINSWGHFTLLKNNSKCVENYKIDTNATANWKEVLLKETNQGFDEKDFNDKCEENKLKIYDGKWAADIDVFYNRMRCVDINTIHNFCKVNRIKSAPKNYKYQIFLVVKGEIYRYYLKFNKIQREKFAYIHFRQEVPIYLKNYKTDTFIVTRKGFYDIDMDCLNSVEKFKKIVAQFNPYDSFLKENILAWGRYIRMMIRYR